MFCAVVPSTYWSLNIAHSSPSRYDSVAAQKRFTSYQVSLLRTFAGVNVVCVAGVVAKFFRLFEAMFE